MISTREDETRAFLDGLDKETPELLDDPYGVSAAARAFLDSSVYLSTKRRTARPEQAQAG